MKNLVFFLSLFLSVGSAKAQGTPCQLDSFWGQPIPVYDTIDFEQTHASIGHVIIDTTYPNNIWQIGTVQKNGFPNAHSGVQVLQTDSLNVYPINNESVAIAYANVASWYGERPFSLCFWHYYDVDSLKDTCKLQMTLDSGNTWLDYYQFSNFSVPFNTSYNGSLIPDSILYWTGNSGGWKRECLCNTVYAIKGQIPLNYGFRFFFHSDSVQTNKPGWMIDDLVFKHPLVLGSVNDHLLQPATVYPNPSKEGIFNIDYPQHYVKGTVEVYNVFGQKMKSLPLSPSIDLRDLPKGIYHYTIFFNNTAQQFAGSLVYE
jgi:hypothetical protein